MGRPFCGPAARLQHLGVHLLKIREMPLTDFVELVKRLAQVQAFHTLKTLDQSLLRHSHQPDLWLLSRNY